MSDNNEQALERVSLRAALGVGGDPDFALMLPAGWIRRPPDDETEQAIIASLQRRLMDAHRPDLYGRLRSQVREAFANMRKVSTLAIFMPGDDVPESAVLPVSLTASIQHAEPGQNLDGFVRDAIAHSGATPLLGDKRTLRVERTTTESLDGEPLRVTTVAYLTPVPGSQRRRALVLSLVVLRPIDVSDEDEFFVQMLGLFDLCVSTLVWLPPDGDMSPSP